MDEWVEHSKIKIDHYNTILKYCGFHYEILNSNLENFNSTIRFQKESIFSTEFLKNSIAQFDTYEKYREYLRERINRNH